MKTWTKVALVIGVVTVVGATGAFAFGRGMHGGRMWKHFVAMRVEAAEDLIQATDAQRAAIDGAKERIIGKLEARMAAHHGEREQWMELFASDKAIDAAAIYAKVDAKAEEAKAMAREVVPELLAVRDLLTPAQRKTLAEHAKKLHGRGGHHGPGGFGGGDE